MPKVLFNCLTGAAFGLVVLASAHGALAQGPAAQAEAGAQRAALEAATQSLARLSAHFDDAGAQEQAGLMAELLGRAEARRAALAELLESDPGEVLRAAVPERVRDGLPEAVQALIEQRLELVGELEVLHLDEAGTGEFLDVYTLKTELGERITLHFAGKAPAGQAGGQVIARGLFFEGVETHGAAGGNSAMALDSDESSLEIVQYCCEDGGTPPAASASPEPDNPIGEQRTLVLMVNFTDTAGQEPFTLAEADDAVFGTVDAFYQEASFGQAWLTGEVHGWYTLPIESTCTTYEISDAANGAAEADGLDLSVYDRFIYVMKGAANCYWSGAAQGHDPSRAWINGSLNTSTIAHELGHNMWLYHSNLLECGETTLGPDCSTPRDDKFDTMGSSPEPSHFNAYQKERLGWFGPDEVLSVTSDSTITLEPYEVGGGADPKVIKVRKETDPDGQGATWYYLEFRQAIGFDSFIAGNDNVLNGVLVHTGADFDANTVLLLDMTPNSSILTSQDRSDPALVAGESFTDPAAGVTFTTNWAGETGASVSITFTQPACVHASPSVTISPPESQWVAPGTPFAYSVTVANGDTDSCADVSFDLLATVPSGWSAAFAEPTLNLAPGASGSTTLTVTSSSSAADGFYDVTASAEHGADPASSGTDAATYVVESTVPNAPPEAVDDSITTTPETPVEVLVLANDSDPDGDLLTVTETSQGSKGVVEFTPEGLVFYTPNPKAKGGDSFTYKASDGMSTATATVSVSISKGGGGGSGGNGGGNGGGGNGGGGNGKGNKP